MLKIKNTEEINRIVGTDEEKTSELEDINEKLKLELRKQRYVKYEK